MKLTPRLQSLGIAALLMTGYGFYAYDYNLIACKLMIAIGMTTRAGA